MFRLSFLLIILAEALSWLGFLVPSLGLFLFFAIVFIILAVSLRDLRYGLWLALAELFIGSKGYLFSWQIADAVVPVRIAIFLVLMAVWLGKTALSFSNQALSDFRPAAQIKHIKESRLFYPLICLFALIAAAFAAGVARGNDFSNVFYDGNGYFAFALAPVFFVVIKTKKHISEIVSLLLGASLALAAKTLITFYLFTHGTVLAYFSMYKWIRDTGVGEITEKDGGFYRIFFQSHFYILAAFILVVVILIKSEKKLRQEKLYLGLTAVFFSALIASQSRSLIFGALAAIIFTAGYVFLFKIKNGLNRLFSIFLSGGVLGALIVAALFFFPFPQRDAAVSFSSFLDDRLSLNEAAVGSRWNLIGPLLNKSKEHLIFGSGLGATVTYKTLDPRLLKQNPSGEYTTYAFEWQYLDLVVKFGLIGAAIYSWFLWRVFYLGAAAAKNKEDRALAAGLLVGFAALLATNVFSPYLNHPLGISYILLVAASFTVFSSADNRV